MFNSLRKKSRWLPGVGLTVILIVLLAGSVAFAGIFGMSDYPGGTLKAVFRIDDPSSDAPPRRYEMKIEPSENGYDVTEEVSSPDRPSDEVTTAFGASGGAGAAGSQYEEDDAPNIDLSPLSALDDKDVDVKPNQNYLLPDGARLVTQGTQTIAGVEVVMGIFLHSNYPNQRVKMAFADRDTRDLLLFPAYLEREEKGEVKTKIELVEFNYEAS